ncbi:recombinase family protein [Isosphaeraceae bacterium EP7]
MKVAIYVRVSTQRQAQTQTIDQQIERLSGHAKVQGWELPAADVFRDDGYSGAALKRPGLDRLRDRAATASFDKILVTDPDRLARNYVHQVLLIEELQKSGCRVEFLDRPMSQDPHDQLLLQIRGAVAEYERALIAERTRRGRQRQFRAGKMLPWTRAPYGYRMAADRPRDPSGVYLDPAEAAVVAEMFAWYLQGRRTLLGLVNHLHEMGVTSPTGKPFWGIASVRGVLTNPVYTGRIYAGRSRYRVPRVRRSATHPIGKPQKTAELLPPEEWITVGVVSAVVTQEQFDQTRVKLDANRSFSARNNKAQTYLLRALVSCGTCGLACQARHVAPCHSYYICTGKNSQVRRRTGVYCATKFIRAKALDELVWQDLCDLIGHPATLSHAFHRAAGGSWLPQEFHARREGLRRGLAGLDQQLERLTEAYLGGVIPLAEYRRRRAEIGQRKAALEQQEACLTGEGIRLDEMAGVAASLEAFRERVSSGLRGVCFEEKRQLVELLIDRVVVTGDEIEIRYVFPTNPGSENVRFCHLRSDYLGGPDPVGSLRCELAIHHILGDGSIVIRVGGAVDRLDLLDQGLAPCLAGRGCAASPPVVAAGGGLQDPAHQPGRPLLAMGLDAVNRPGGYRAHWADRSGAPPPPGRISRRTTRWDTGRACRPCLPQAGGRTPGRRRDRWRRCLGSPSNGPRRRPP